MVSYLFAMIAMALPKYLLVLQPLSLALRQAMLSRAVEATYTVITPFNGAMPSTLA